MQNKQANNKGFTLAEMIIAIFVITVGILGAYLAIQQATKVIVHSYNRLIAAYLAQEGIEIIKNIRDTNFLEKHVGIDPANLWDEGFDVDGCYEADWSMLDTEDPSLLSCASRFLKFDGNSYSYAGGQDTRFQRRIEVLTESPDVKRITVTIQWQEGNKTFDFQVVEKIYNWL